MAGAGNRLCRTWKNILRTEARRITLLRYQNDSKINAKRPEFRGYRSHTLMACISSLRRSEFCIRNS